jgi:hypothetical protein
MAQRLSDMVAERPVVEERKVFRLGDIAAMENVQYDDEEEKVMFSPSAESVIGVPDELRQSYKAQGKIGAFEAFARNAKPWTFLPFGSSVDTGVESIAIMSSMNRLQANDYKEGDGMVQRNKDALAINEYLRDKVEEQERGYSFGGQVVNVVKELPAVMVEFMATGGASVGGRMVARKGAEKLLSKVMEKSATKIVARKAAGTVGSIATRTAMLGSVKIPAGTAQRMVNDRVELTDKGVKILDQGKTKPFTSLIKSVGDVAFEVTSEQSGGTIRKIAGAVLSPVQKAIAPGVARFAGNKMVMAITRITDKLKAGGLAKEMADKAKFDGILEEYGEERWGNFLRAASGVEDFGAGDNSNVMDRVIASVPSIEESLVELAAFSIPAGGQLAMSYAENLKTRVEAEPEVSEQIITQVADEIIAQQTEVEKPVEKAMVAEPIDTEYDVAPIPTEDVINDEKRYLASEYGAYLGGLEPGGTLRFSDPNDGPSRVIGRDKSQRPKWWQDLGIDMPRTQLVFGKVARGEELTTTQQRDYDILVKGIQENDSYVVDTLKEKRIYERKRMDYEQAGGTQEEIDELIGIIGEAQSVEEIGFTDQDFIDEISDSPIVPEIPKEPTDQPQPEGDKPRGLSVSIEADTIKEGLVKDLGDLPTYQTRNMEDIATRVSEFINKDYELAKRIALGEAEEQDGLRAQELYTGIRIKATMEGDVDTLRDLAMSEQATAMATELGQRIKALDTGTPEDPVTAIRSLKKTRTEAIEKKVGKAKVKADIKNSVNQVKESTKKAAKKMDWAGFVASLEC